jgi:hypothetical protein
MIDLGFSTSQEILTVRYASWSTTERVSADGLLNKGATLARLGKDFARGKAVYDDLILQTSNQETKSQSWSCWIVAPFYAIQIWLGDARLSRHEGRTAHR